MELFKGTTVTVLYGAQKLLLAAYSRVYNVVATQY